MRMEKKGKYGVIGCTRCRQVKGVNLSHEKTKCPRCGKILKINNEEILYQTNDEKDLQLAVGIINKRIMEE